MSRNFTQSKSTIKNSVKIVMCILVFFVLVQGVQAAAPTFKSITPSSGPTAGGTKVTITGTNFVSGGSFGVKIGGNWATSVFFDSPIKITAVTPAGTAGAKDVVITNNDGQNVIGMGAYTYVTAPTTTGIYRNGNFYLASSNIPGGGTVTAFNFGMTGDVPVAGDWNGDGTTTVGIYRSGNFYLASSNIPGGGTVNAFNFGGINDVPVTGDWNGDGMTEVGYFRNGMFYLRSSTGGTYDSFNYGYGLTDDKPIAGDWNGDGKTEVGVFTKGWFFLRNSTGGTYNYFTYGQTGDAPIAGDWDGDGNTEIGVFRNGMFYLRSSTGGTYAKFNYGAAGDTPVTGKWT